MSFIEILAAFYRFAICRLLPLLAAWPVWSLRARQAQRRRVPHGNPKRNPTALR